MKRKSEMCIILFMGIILLTYLLVTHVSASLLGNATNLSKATETDGKDLSNTEAIGETGESNGFTSFSSCPICNKSTTLSAASNETSGTMIGLPSIEEATVNLSSATSNETSGTMIGLPSIEGVKSVGAKGEVLNSTGYVPEGVPTPIGASQALDAQNAYRAAVGESPLVWSSTLASSAQAWAQHLAATNTFAHSCTSCSCGYGENLAAGWPSSSYTDAQLVKLWGDEKQFFKCGTFPDVSTTGDWTKVGHYTQMVWPTTTQCGCGEATSSADHKILVCQYQPSGNVIGQYICPQGKNIWKAYGSNAIYMDLDASSAGFTATPFYFTSLGGTSNHWLAQGVSAIYSATSKGFRIYLKNSNGAALTPALANSYGWRVQALGVPTTNVKAGSTPKGTTNWKAYGTNAIYVDVNTAVARFTATPRYFTSLGGNSNHRLAQGVSAIYSATSKGFRIYLKNSNGAALTPALANSYGWYVQWLGVPTTNVKAGSTPKGTTNWKAYGTNAIYVDVNTAAAGFTATPSYFTSLGGNTNHWTALGVNAIYSATAKGFRIYLKDSSGAALTPAYANSKGWYVQWLGA